MAGITMQDVAKACEVSKMSVSLALRNHPSIPKATREKIQIMASEMGYKVSPYMSRLMAQIRTSPEERNCVSVAFLNHFPGKLAKAVTDPLRHFYQGAIKRALEKGFITYEFPRPTTPHEQLSQRRRLMDLGVDGVIVFPFEESLGRRDLDWAQYPVVTLGYTYGGDECHRVCCDYYRNARIVIRELMERGRQRIGFICSKWVHTRTYGRLTGGILSAAHDETGPTILPPLWMDKFSAEKVFAYIRKNQCDALAYFQYFPVVEALKKKLRIPEDVSVASCALTEQELNRGISGLDEQTHLVGERAFDCLTSLIISNSRASDYPTNEILIPGVWRSGWTV